jgi:hypothetical protein
MRGLILTLLLVPGIVACNSPQAVPTYPIAGRAVAGPTCGAEPASPAPGQCTPRPVAGAILVISDVGGHEVARVTTASDGSWTATLAAGTYTLTAQPVQGLLGTARPVTVLVSAGPAPSSIEVEYDTGIR